jgi:membrane protease subunit (stomatin/prohibitin family)
MNLKELATKPSIHLPNGRVLSKVSDHNEHTIFVNTESVKEHKTDKGTYVVELAIAPSFTFKKADEDFNKITELFSEFGEKVAVKVKQSSRQHIYFESMHSVYGRKADGKPIKLTYIKTHISTNK